MGRIFTTGLMAVFALGVVVIVLKFIVVDVLAFVFGPLILLWLGKEYLIIPLSIAFTILLIFLAGLLLSLLKFREIIRNVLTKVLPKGERGALLKINPGVYYLAIVVTKIKRERKDGTIKPMYVLFAPYAPIPWSGLPIIFADEDKVTPVKLSWQDIFGIVTSFGRNTPNKVEEIDNKGTN